MDACYSDQLRLELLLPMFRIRTYAYTRFIIVQLRSWTADH
jgi:hypothetical protein